MSHPEITLTEELARIVTGAGKAMVAVKNPAGELIGLIDPQDMAAVQRARERRATGGPVYSSEQVRQHMFALELEWDRIGGFGREYMEQFLAKIRAADPPYRIVPPAAGEPGV